MQDDLQKAYAAYQQALYHLPNPKVRNPPRLTLSHLPPVSLCISTCVLCCRTRNSGMALESFTTVMGPSITPRRRSHRYCAWTQVSESFVFALPGLPRPQFWHRSDKPPLLNASLLLFLPCLIFSTDADFEKAEEILFRLGIIYKQQQKYTDSLEVRPFPIPHSPRHWLTDVHSRPSSVASFTS